MLLKMFAFLHSKYNKAWMTLSCVMTIFFFAPYYYAEAQSLKTTSVLNEGSWYKMGIIEDGIYCITYDDLVEMGIQPETLNPKKISLFGNYPGMLPENNSEGCYDDLSEISIIVNGEDDGSFDEDDYILFFGQKQVEWDFEYIRGGYCQQINFY